MGRLFGTDGIRGLANRELTAELALDVSVAAAHVLAETGAFQGHRPFAIVGRDPRASGEFLEAAVVAGLASAGVDVQLVGVLPTPAIAYLTSHWRADLGVMLSASHNPMADNGIKFFTKGGYKLPDSVEDEVESRVGETWDRPTGAGVGRVRTAATANEAYVSHLLSTLGIPGRPGGHSDVLAGLRLVVDCAHGAATPVAVSAFEAAGADVVALHDAPDGTNINEGCGSTSLDALQQVVLAEEADLGIALDGDADRCLAVDRAGDVVDGDQILAILAMAWRDAGRLANNSVVSTVMANLGFRKAMEREGIAVVATSVGDRYVLAEMLAGGFNLGGEQSGHLIMTDYATTGDGLLTGLHLAGQLAAADRPLAELASVVERFPQVLLNVEVADRSIVDSATVRAAVADEERLLSSNGRVLLRASGTEPLIRIMVEAPTEELAVEHAERLAKVVRESQTSAQ